MWTPIDRPAGDTRTGVPGGRLDPHLASIPACAALGVREAEGAGRVLALAVDPWLAAVRSAGGGVDRGAALLLADQATAQGIFAILPAPVPMMTLGLRIDWVTRAGTGALMCAIDDVVRDGDLALVRGVLSSDGALTGTVTARYLLGAMPGGHRGQPSPGAPVAPSTAASFDAYLDATEGEEGLTVAPRWEHVGARLLPAFHGGVIAALLERAACRPLVAGYRPLDMEVRFIAPGRADRPLHASAQPRRIGRRAATIDVTAWQDDPATPVAVGRMMAVSDAYWDVDAFRLA